MNNFVGAPYAKNSDTSREAAESIVGISSTMNDLILEIIARRGGATCDEIEAALGLRHQSASARLWDMERKGKVEKSSARRTTRSGRSAAVYVIVRQAAA
jgi:predicted ArsR family transcriptional regulator